MLGYEPNATEISFPDLRRFMHTDDHAFVTQFFDNYVAEKGSAQFETEFRMRRADGLWCWVLSKGRAVEWDEFGTPERIIGLDINIDSFREAQDKVNQSEKKFRAIFDNAPYSIVINSLEDGRYLQANKAFLDSRGVKPEELAQLKAESFSLISREDVADIFDTLMKKGFVKNREVKTVTKDGAIRYSTFSSVIMDIQGQKQILSMTVDTTERKRAEDALKESEARFRKLFKLAPIPMSYISMDGKILDVNDSLVKTMGYTADDMPTLEHAWEHAFTDNDLKNEITSKWRASLENAIKDHSDIESIECPVRCKNGSFRDMIVSTKLIGDSIIISFFDITERKQAEAEREVLQSQLYQSQKMEAIGVFAGGIAHDFNNMLGAILGYSELMLSKLDASNPFREFLNSILDAAQRSAKLTRQLLAFSRQEMISPVIFDLNEAVEAILKMIRRLIGENIELIWLPGEMPGMVRMDPTQLDQILVNLCVNARDAIKDTGRVTIETNTVVIDDQHGEGHAELLPGAYVILAVKDDGCGIDTKTLSHIFEPFFTTKALGKGTGMGLATIYGIVNQNNGAINVYSELEKGTTFTIYIPRHAAEKTPEKQERMADLPKSRGETLLIVEDDPMLLGMSMLMMQKLGYSALTASTPGEAVRIVEEDHAEIHLLITDVIMPEMNGRDLVNRLQKFQPGIKHLFMSGYTADVIAHQGVLNEGVNFIQKPFSLKTMALKIREVLD